MAPWWALSVRGHFRLRQGDFKRQTQNRFQWQGPCFMPLRRNCASRRPSDKHVHLVHTCRFVGHLSIQNRSLSYDATTTNNEQTKDDSYQGTQQVISRTTDGFVWPNLYQEARGMAMGTLFVSGVVRQFCFCRCISRSGYSFHRNSRHHVFLFEPFSVFYFLSYYIHPA